MTSKQNILFLCAETFPPPYAFLEKVFNERLREYGFNFTWIMPTKGTTEIEEINWNGSPTIVIPKIRPQGITDLAQAYWRYLRYIQRASQLALKSYGPFHILQVRDDPAMAYVTWRLAKKLKLPFVYQISHLKEEETMMYAQMGIYGSPLKNKIQGKVGFMLRNFFLQRAELVFPISDQMRETLTHYGIPRKRMVTLPEGVDTSIIPAEYDDTAKEIRNKLGLEGKKVLIYVGTLNRFRQLDLLLRALKQARELVPDVHLLVVGGGKVANDLSWLKKTADELGVKNSVDFTGRVPRSEVPGYIRTADIGLSPFPPNRVLINNSPIKILEYLALEIPCVASNIPSQRQVIEESQGGLCVSHTEEEFAKAITKLLNLSGNQRRQMGRVARGYIKRFRDFRILAEIARKAYLDLKGEAN